MTELHFTRVRGSSSKDFFDPASDIVRLVPVAVQCALNMSGLKSGVDLDTDYLISCWNVFEMRLREDSLPVTEQIDLFLKAVRKVPAERMELFYRLLSRVLISVYALFLRAQSEMKRDELSRAFTFSEVGALEGLLSEETLAAVRKDLAERLPKPVPNAPTADGSIMDDNSGDVYVDDVRAIATCLLPATGERTWDAMAKAADEWFAKYTGDDKSLKSAIVAALSYPTYDSPCMSARLEKKDAQPE